ncbi:MAG: DNA alkylation repair protein [Candidatus Hodarchaeales archaeon]
MSLTDIFDILLTKNNHKPLQERIYCMKEKIPKKQRTGKGIVWVLRQLRKQVQNEIPLSIQKKSLDLLINGDDWQIRKFTAFIATNCCLEEGYSELYVHFIRQCAVDSHFGVRESAQMAMRELLQFFRPQIHRIFEEWIIDDDQNLRRCVSESLRPVLVYGKNWIRDEPDIAIALLKNLNMDPSLYVRKSVGNNLSDISRREPKLVLATLYNWLVENNYDKRTFFIARKACRNIIKEFPLEVNELLRGQSIIR